MAATRAEVGGPALPSFELGYLRRETRGLAAGALARAGRPFLLEESLVSDEPTPRTIPTRALAPRAEIAPALFADMSRRIVHVLGSRRGRDDEITIGRGRDCDVRLPLSSVSQDHAAILRRPTGAFAIRDHFSRNGTFVDGHRVVPGGEAALASGSSIRFGREAVLTFLDGEAMERVLAQLDALERDLIVPAPADATSLEVSARRLVAPAALPRYLQGDTDRTGPSPEERSAAAPGVTGAEVAELLRTLGRLRVTGTVLLDARGISGRIDLDTGLVWRARVGTLTGAAALLRASFEPSLTVSLAAFEPGPREITEPLDALLPGAR